MGDTWEIVARAKYDVDDRRRWTARLVYHAEGTNAGEHSIDYFVPDDSKANGKRRRWRSLGSDAEEAERGFRKFLRHELPAEIQRANRTTARKRSRLRDVRTVGAFRDWYVNRFLDGLGASGHAKRKADEVLEALAKECRRGDSGAISKVSVQEISAVRSQFRRSFTKRYVRQRETILRQALRVAVVAGLIRRHPVAEWAEDVDSGAVYLSKAQRARIVRHAGEYADLVEEIAETGLERGFAADGYGVSVSTVRRAISRAADRAGVAGHVTTHTFRDSLLADALRRGDPLDAIAEGLGYADAASVVAAIERKRLVLEAYLSRL